MSERLRVGLVGVGKMGLSHQAIVNTHPEAELVGVCDSSSTLLRLLKKYTGIATFSSFDAMLKGADLDAVIISTPSRSHGPLVEKAIERGLRVTTPGEGDVRVSIRIPSVLPELGLGRVGATSHFRPQT